jgi:hypothetical protein
MYFCSLSTSDGSTIIGYQYSSVELFNIGNPPITNLSDATTLCHSVNSAFDAINGAFNYSTDINTVTNLFDNYFSFDSSIFEQIIGFGLVIFITGFSAGVIVKLLSRNNAGHY